jgi:hypothetical protein
LSSLKRFLSLSGAERWLIVRAAISLAAVDFKLRTRSLERVLLGMEGTRVRADRAITPSDVERARRYARWIDVASRYHAVHARCLHRSLALHQWLQKEGLPSRLRIGVRKEQDDLKAHAWVELGDAVVNDSAIRVADFTPLAPALSGRLPWLEGPSGTTGQITGTTGTEGDAARSSRAAAGP